MTGNSHSDSSQAESIEQTLTEYNVILEADLAQILIDVYNIQLPEDMIWLCKSSLEMVATASYEGFRDSRARYLYSISYLKLISITAFWLIKLKPINNVGLIDKSTQREIDFPDINESVATYWAIANVGDAIARGRLTELVTNSSPNIENYIKIVKYYYTENIYRSIEDSSPIENTQKVNELIFNLRMKKFSAVNIYEVLCHIIIPFKMFRLEESGKN